MKIGLYFGSFNPVHNAHLIIANYILQQTDITQVWFVISPQNPFKNSSTLLNEYHRKHLIDISIEGESGLKTSTVEFSLPKPSYTIDTLSYLKEKYPEHSFTIIIGSDSYSNLDKWKNYESVSEYPMIIYTRPGFKSTPLKKNHILIEAPLLDISSTYIRSLIKQRKSIRFLVPDKVNEEIERTGYYK